MSCVQIDGESCWPASGWEGLFLVTKTGRVFSVRKNRWILGKRHKWGYRVITTTRDGVRYSLLVHRLIASTFLVNDDPSLDVCHQDNDTANNTLENLKWGSRSENMEHCAESGRLPVAKITPEIARLIKAERSSGRKIQDLADQHGLSSSHVSNICSGRAWRHAA